jgi:hypothetical protein
MQEMQKSEIIHLKTREGTEERCLDFVEVN